jgi:hypothetical protein
VLPPHFRRERGELAQVSADAERPTASSEHYSSDVTLLAPRDGGEQLLGERETDGIAGLGTTQGDSGDCVCNADRDLRPDLGRRAHRAVQPPSTISV